MEVTNSIWFTQMGSVHPIGIVIVKGADTAYIGIGAGFEEEEDEIHIARTGAKFPLSLAKELMG